MNEVEVVILRFSLGICSPGCLHLVLESVSPKAPYLLENRTAHPFQYKQAGIGKLVCLPWLLGPEYAQHHSIGQSQLSMLLSARQLAQLADSWTSPMS